MLHHIIAKGRAKPQPSVFIIYYLVIIARIKKSRYLPWSSMLNQWETCGEIVPSPFRGRTRQRERSITSKGSTALLGDAGKGIRTAGLQSCEHKAATQSWKGPRSVCCYAGSHRTAAGLSAKLKESTCLQAKSGQGEVYL